MYVVDVDMIKCRRCSSVVEHVIGNDGVVSPILISGTNKTKKTGCKAGLLCFKCVSVAETDLRQDCVSNPKVRNRHRRAKICEAAEMS